MSALESILSSFPDRVGTGKNTHIYTPAHIAKEMVDALPDDIWNKDTTFLDICCKSGIFLYKIYEKLMESPSMKADFPDKQSRREYILKYQLFGISPDQLCQMMSTRAVYGYLPENSHIISFGDNYNHVMQNPDKRFLLETLQKEFNMKKFGVVIGNPPYNKGMDLDFVDMGYKLSSNITAMITPAKWQTAEADQKIVSKMSYGEFRKQLVPHMSMVCFYPDCMDIFLIHQADGICYYIIDKDNHSECKVINKSVLQTNYNNEKYRSICNGQTLNNIGQEVIDVLGNYKNFKFDTINGNKRFQVWCNTQLALGAAGFGSGGYNRKAGQGGCLYSLSGNAMYLGLTRIIDTQRKSNDKAGASKCVFESDSLDECQSFVSWINSKFTRYFISINISALTLVNNHTFRFVPAPPSGKFDHIYTDEELYKAFNLPQKYIDVIEAVIKERK